MSDPVEQYGIGAAAIALTSGVLIWARSWITATFEKAEKRADECADARKTERVEFLAALKDVAEAGKAATETVVHELGAELRHVGGKVDDLAHQLKVRQAIEDVRTREGHGPFGWQQGGGHGQ